MRKLLIKLGSSALLAATLSVGFAHGASISDTGPHSNNQIIVGDHASGKFTNDTSVNITNSNYQTATSGNAVVAGNTRGGNATSGNASNYNQTSNNVGVSNGSNPGPKPSGNSSNYSITNTGPDSTNKIIVGFGESISVSNRTSVGVSNQNHQTASSGDAIVEGNTRGGNATSGNASNSNSTTTTVMVENGSKMSFAKTAPMFGQARNNWDKGDKQHEMRDIKPCKPVHITPPIIVAPCRNDEHKVVWPPCNWASRPCVQAIHHHKHHHHHVHNHCKRRV